MRLRGAPSMTLTGSWPAWIGLSRRWRAMRWPR
nr:MAG TPA: hypothetical protein [Bacteriophage sp.]